MLSAPTPKIELQHYATKEKLWERLCKSKYFIFVPVYRKRKKTTQVPLLSIDFYMDFLFPLQLVKSLDFDWDFERHFCSCLL